MFKGMPLVKSYIRIFVCTLVLEWYISELDNIERDGIDNNPDLRI